LSEGIPVTVRFELNPEKFLAVYKVALS